MHCPNCNRVDSQHYVGEAFNTTSFTHEGNWRCDLCRCEYTEKDSGRVVVTKPGMTSHEIAMEAGKLWIESIAADIERKSIPTL